MAHYSYPAPQPPAYAYSEPRYLVTLPARRVSFWRDVYNGAVLGDFAREKRLGGAFMQILLAFTPVVGTICAARDCIADLRYRDLLGAFLNLLALFPVFGGVPKALEVIIGFWHAHHVWRSRGHRQPRQYYVPVSAVPTRPLPPTRSRQAQQPQRYLPPPSPRQPR